MTSIGQPQCRRSPQAPSAGTPTFDLSSVRKHLDVTGSPGKTLSLLPYSAPCTLCSLLSYRPFLQAPHPQTLLQTQLPTLPLRLSEAPQHLLIPAPPPPRLQSLLPHLHQPSPSLHHQLFLTALQHALRNVAANRPPPLAHSSLNLVVAGSPPPHSPPLPDLLINHPHRPLPCSTSPLHPSEGPPPQLQLDLLQCPLLTASQPLQSASPRLPVSNPPPSPG